MRTQRQEQKENYLFSLADATRDLLPMRARTLINSNYCLLPVLPQAAINSYQLHCVLTLLIYKGLSDGC